MQRIPYSAEGLAYQGNGVQKPINGERILFLLSPPLLQGLGQLGAAILIGAKLDAALRELAILRVAHLSKCAYSAFHHGAVGRRAGLLEEKIQAVTGSTDTALWSKNERAVLKFTDDIVVHVRPGDATLKELRDCLSDTEVMELIVSVGTYMTLCRILETTGIEIDAEPVGAGLAG